ncbi:MAG: hypothetical protein MH321_09700 [Leptospiraceae bacterium]|nr:hypothetical protein [Leptospiraceae bacterium]
MDKGRLTENSGNSVFGNSRNLSGRVMNLKFISYRFIYVLVKSISFEILFSSFANFGKETLLKFSSKCIPEVLENFSSLPIAK